MNLLKTLKTNWRDILVASLLVLAISFIADIVGKLAVTNNGVMWMVSVVQALKGIAMLAAANLSAFLIFAVSWPTLNKFGNDSFTSTWNSLTNKERFDLYATACFIEIIAAAIVFS